MKNAIETHEYRGLKIEVHVDDNPESPRGWGNLGKMVCWHRRYELGDEQPGESPEDYLTSLADKAVRFKADEITRKHIEAVLEKHYLILPLHLYDHSGITMKCSPFSCPLDSGQVGFIYISLKGAQDNWPSADKSLGWDAPVFYKHDGTTKTLRERARDLLVSEVNVYDQYLTGEVYGYVVSSEENDHIDSCWGCFGSDETSWHDAHAKRGYMMQCARDAADAHLRRKRELDTQLCVNI